MLVPTTVLGLGLWEFRGLGFGALGIGCFGVLGFRVFGVLGFRVQDFGAFG